ncbi:GntR family transcriptional regulator [Chelativorans sp.]|uniref:GntR family transcriptional regulator n=1 Tax=Chelativorans sp. TaxID=2203393 RepID=UPI002811A701|nr:GntR family transcriptional regulator [Chelativorans sp.]
MDRAVKENGQGAAAQGAVESAYRRIRHMILTGQMRSGDKLLENHLAAQIGVSRTPVREALNRLNAEGLVVLERYRRGYVASFSVEDVREIFRLRAILESHAAYRAASRISDADLQRLQELERAMESQFDALGWNEHLEGFDQMNTQFHAIIAAAAESPRLERILASSLELPASIFNRYSEPVEIRTRRTHAQHREILSALKARNPEWAQAAMSAHLISLLPPDGAGDIL